MNEYIKKCVAKIIISTAQTKHDAIEMISGIPTDDVVEVVRCRDCKHTPLETWFECPLSHLKYDENRWCWKGEKK